MAKRGRPRGRNINPVALEDWLAVRCLSKAELAERCGIGAGHLADMLYRGKGTSEAVIRRMAAALGCQPASIAPEFVVQDDLTFAAVRRGDPEAAA